jgi:RimJ/RimL family protein N-acetyltransferase
VLAVNLRAMQLQAYTDADLALTEALETDPEVMRELGGPIERDKLPGIHRRRLSDPWWFKIVERPGGPAVGTIGVWETRHSGVVLHETGWMVLPAHQGRGIASAALALLIDRARGVFPSLHAFPPVTNAPSNALCRKFGFTLLGPTEFVYSGRTLKCHHWSLALRAEPAPHRDARGG